MSADPLKAIRELIGAMPHTGEGDYFTGVTHAPKICVLCKLESALTAAEQELRERDSDDKLANESTAAIIEKYEADAKQADARVAAAFALALRIIEESPTWNKHKGASLCHCEVCAYVRGNASEIRALTPPEATAALEKMLLEARRDALKRFGWKMNNSLNDWQTILQEEGEWLDAQLAALTGEKKA